MKKEVRCNFLQNNKNFLWKYARSSLRNDIINPHPPTPGILSPNLNFKRAKLSGIKFLITTLLKCWSKPQTKARNFPLKGRKLLFSVFEITFFHVSHRDDIYGENVKRKKSFPIKFSISNYSQFSVDLIRKPEISAQKVWRRKSDAVFYKIT